MKYTHEIIKVPEKFLAWIYDQQDNHIDTVAMHWHRSLELTYITQGSVLYEINGHTFVARQGDVILINSCDTHKCIPNYESTSNFFSVIFPYNFVLSVMPNFNDYRYVINPNSSAYKRLVREFDEAYPIFKNRDNNSLYQLKLNSLFYEILYIIFTDCKVSQPIPNSIRSQKNIVRCMDILDYIDKHYNEDLTLESIANTFFISKEHLARTFKNYMSTTVKKYITRIRLDHAYQSLIHTDIPIMQIALDNGFSDARAFSRAFHTHYGEKPLTYRKSLKPSTSHTKALHLYTKGYL